MGCFTSGTDCYTISALSETPHELEHGIENLKWSCTRVITERFKRGWELCRSSPLLCDTPVRNFVCSVLVNTQSLTLLSSF